MRLPVAYQQTLLGTRSTALYMQVIIEIYKEKRAHVLPARPSDSNWSKIWNFSWVTWHIHLLNKAIQEIYSHPAASSSSAGLTQGMVAAIYPDSCCINSVRKLHSCCRWDVSSVCRVFTAEVQHAGYRKPTHSCPVAKYLAARLTRELLLVTTKYELWNF